jgi:hypothetical protein
LLWQTDTITMRMSILWVNQTKVLINTEKLQLVKPINLDKVLYFPAVERNTRAGSHVFELWNFVKRLQDDLGESMPIDNLKDMKKHFDSIIL